MYVHFLSLFFPFPTSNQNDKYFSLSHKLSLSHSYAPSSNVCTSHLLSFSLKRVPTVVEGGLANENTPREFFSNLNRFLCEGICKIEEDILLYF
jgi:hypothetical protein